MVLMMPINGFVATKQRNLQIQQMKLKDERIKLMNEVLSGIKVSLFAHWLLMSVMYLCCGHSLATSESV